MASLILAGSLFGAAGAARADDAVALALHQPALLSTRAASGLFTSIARAGRRLVAVGEAGRILVSDDDGRNWRQVPAPTSVTLTRVMFTDAAQGWALGQMGAVLHTTDGGLSWRFQLDGVAANRLTLASARAALAAQAHDATMIANLQSAEALAAGGPNVPFLDILALGSGRLILVGAFGLAMQSDDDGGHWRSIANEVVNSQGLHLYAAVAAAGRIMLAGEQGLVLAGPPAGPFEPVASPFGGTYFGMLAAPDGGLLLYGLQGTILRSTDQGLHWTAMRSGVTAGIDTAAFLRDGGLIFGDVGGDLLLTRDGGEHFTSLLPPGPPICALAQAADGAIVIGRPDGLQRVPLAHAAADLTAHAAVGAGP